MNSRLEVQAGFFASYIPNPFEDFGTTIKKFGAGVVAYVLSLPLCHNYHEHNLSIITEKDISGEALP